MRLIPAIDLRAGRCIRLLQGEFEKETVYRDDAVQLAVEYRDLGADWLHVVDLDGAKGEGQDNRALLVELAAVEGLRLQVGGGIRDATFAAELLSRGVERLVVGSLAVTQPQELVRWLQRFGPDKVVLALDVRLDQGGVPMIATHGWRRQSELSLWTLLERFNDHGLIHVLTTDIGRDGALSGPNLGLYQEALKRYPHIDWQASGGIRDGADLEALSALGLAAAISGRALLEKRLTAKELRPFLPSA